LLIRSLILFQFESLRCCPGLAANGLHIGDGGAFEKRQPNIGTTAQ